MNVYDGIESKKSYGKYCKATAQKELYETNGIYSLNDDDLNNFNLKRNNNLIQYIGNCNNEKPNSSGLFFIDNQNTNVDHSTSSNNNSKTDNVKQGFKLPKFRVKQIRVKSIKATTKTSVESTTSADGEHASKTAEPSIDSEHLNLTLATSDSLESICTKDTFHSLISRVKNENWNIALKALQEISNNAYTYNWHELYAHMIEINQRLIQLLRSPRSHVCRLCCNIAGHLFAVVKDTRRPEFDEIVEILLLRTADSNQFIRSDANKALDSLIMHVPPFHTVRAISQKGPNHKHDLIRMTTARLFVCIVGIAGTNLIMNHAGNEFTRKRLLIHMVTFIKDRNIKTREYGIRLYMLLYEHSNFEHYLNKVVDRTNKQEMRKILKEKHGLIL